ncbi:hypothetical protein V5799_012618 [Amblyomma americanum]|uniref:Uncharacterized protein n=1 Tax=Amblyomma americanum TaxID=6943 RepID=A0AAQ4EDW6_AMBAM
MLRSNLPQSSIEFVDSACRDCCRGVEHASPASLARYVSSIRTSLASTRNKRVAATVTNIYVSEGQPEQVEQRWHLMPSYVTLMPSAAVPMAMRAPSLKTWTLRGQHHRGGHLQLAGVGEL